MQQSSGVRTGRAASLRAGVFAVLAAFGLAAAQTAVAQTTGKLSGVVADEAGAPLPGVTVSIASPSLIGGERSETTDAEGQYLFANLAPGEYSLKAELDGFATVEQSGVVVRLDRTAQIDVTLGSGTVTEQITVTGELPVVDVQQTSQGQVFQQEYLAKASIGSGGRNYLSVIGQTAGVAGTGNVRVFGSTGAENAFLIDGINTTDPVTSTFGTNFNFDAIQEISFTTGGFDAEYGGATGGLVNLVTKSGGNDFSGSLDVRYSDNDFNENGEFFDKNANKTKFIQPGATLGGPIQRDKVWFFASAEDISTEVTPTGSPTTREFEGQNYLGKITWQVNPTISVVGKYSSDPAEITNANAGRFVAPEATRTQEQGGDIANLALSAVIGANGIFDFSAGINRQELNSFPTSGDFDTPGITDQVFGTDFGNYTAIQLSDRDRDEFKASYAHFLDGLAGSHEFKGGVQADKLGFKTVNNVTGGAQYIDDAGDPFLFQVTPNAAALEFEGDHQGAFLQDSWRVGDQLTLKFGVRYDEVAYDNEVGSEVASLDKVQPRFGFAWDLGKTGTTVVRGYWGRFMHPNALTLPNFARTTFSPTDRYISCSTFFGSATACRNFAASRGGVVVADPLGRDPLGYGFFDTLSSSANEVDQDLQAMYADSYSVGVEHRFGPQTSLEVSYVKKETRDIFEDTCNGNFPAVGGSPDCDFYVMTNIDALKRDYEGVLVRLETKALDRVHLNASYTNSKSQGSIDDTQNAGIDADIFPDHFANIYGYMPDDRRHRVKVNGYVELPLDFSLAFDAFWSSAFAYDSLRALDVPSYGDEFVEPRGSRRGNENYGLDLELRKGFTISDLRFEVVATVQNVLDDELVTAVCERVDGCGDDGDGQPINFGDATTHAQPRSYEAGFRFTF
jgi:hypothetical protein